MAGVQIVNGNGKEELTEIHEKIFTDDKQSQLKEAEILFCALEDYVQKRYAPTVTSHVGSGMFQLKLDEVRSKVDALTLNDDQPETQWLIEKISFLMNLSRNLETAKRCSRCDSIDEGVSACNDTDQLLDCLRSELKQRHEELPILKSVVSRLAKVRAFYLTELSNSWDQQVLLQISEFPPKRLLRVSNEAQKTFELLSSLRCSGQTVTEILTDFIENFVRPVVASACEINIREKNSSVELELQIFERADETKVNTTHNLQTIFAFISGHLLPLLSLQEDSREIGALLNLLVQRTRNEATDTIDEIATSIENELPQTSALLSSYAADFDASKEALQMISEMEEMMITSLDPTDEVEIPNVPSNLARTYVVSSWIPSLADSITRIENESILLPVFSCLLKHFTSLVEEGLANPTKAAIYLNNCIYLANRCSLCPAAPTNFIILLKQKGTSQFLKFVNQQKITDIPVTLPVTSALSTFLKYIDSLTEMEESWKKTLPFESYSKATALLYNSFSNALEAYVFQQKFLTDYEAKLLRSLLQRAVSFAEAWQRASESKLHVSNARLSHLLELLTMTADDIGLSWNRLHLPLKNVFTPQQVLSLTKARFELGAYDELRAVII